MHRSAPRPAARTHPDARGEQARYAEPGRHRLEDRIGNAFGKRGQDEQVEAARTLVESRFREPLRLGEIAEAVGSSPFHFARVFKQKTGLPVHRYLQKTRLRVALEEVMSGSSSLTTLAFDLGFSSQSHFTSTFSREFGVPPSRVRDAVREGRLGSFPPL